MGIYDRDYIHEGYAARSGGLFRGHSAVVVLIAANIVVFMLWQFMGSEHPFMEAHFTVSRDGVLGHFRFHTLMTAAFSQYDLWHILFNMLFLYFFGKEVEEIYGPRDFVLLYLMAGFVSSWAHIAIEPEIAALGASGSVMGITITCACFQPNREIRFLLGFIIPLQLKLKWIALFFVASDLLGVLNPAGSNIAHAAHLGGALIGFLYFKLDLRFFGLETQVRGKVGLFHKLLRLFFPTGDLACLRFKTRWIRLFGRGRPVHEVDFQRPSEPRAPAPAPQKAHVRVDSETARRVDQLLAKISRQGIGSLTNEEREFLDASSKKYK